MDNYYPRKTYHAIPNLPYVFDLKDTDGFKLKLVAVKGGGGFSKTYTGKYYDRISSSLSSEEDTYTPVVVKEFFLSGKCAREGEKVIVLDNPDMVERYREKFRQEAKILSTLNHDNIIKVMLQFEANNTSYYVMQQIKGITLTELIYNPDVSKRKCLKLSEAIKILDGVFKALSYMHNQQKPILHLDIKPENIIVENNGYFLKPYLIDFGLCKSATKDNGRIELSQTNQAGSQGYSPRELTITKNDYCQYITISPATDIYSLGATLYFLLTGVVPASWAYLSDSGLKYPLYADPRAIHILQKAMQIKDTDRIQSVEKFRELCNEAFKEPDEGGFETRPACAPPENTDMAFVDGFWTISLKDDSTPVKVGKSSAPIQPEEGGYETVILGDLGKSGSEVVPDSTDKETGETGSDNPEEPTGEKTGPFQTDEPIKSDESKAENVNSFSKYVVYAAAVLFGILATWFISERIDFNRTSEPAGIEKDKDAEKPSDEATRQDSGKISPDRLTVLLLDFFDGKSNREDVERLFTKDAFFLITDGTTLVGTPDDPNHTLSMLLTSDYLTKKGYRVRKVVYQNDGELIQSIRIGK